MNERGANEGSPKPLGRAAPESRPTSPHNLRIRVIELSARGNTVGCVRVARDDDEAVAIQVAQIRHLAAGHPNQLRLRRMVISVGAAQAELGSNVPAAAASARDDIALLTQWIGEGWVEHVIWHDLARISRDPHSVETIVNGWASRGVGLWLTAQGRQLDYQSDRLWLRVSASLGAAAPPQRPRLPGLTKRGAPVWSAPEGGHTLEPG